jgi:hypothetical protein
MIHECFLFVCLFGLSAALPVCAANSDATAWVKGQTGALSTYVLSNFRCSSAMNPTASPVRMVSYLSRAGPRITTPLTRAKEPDQPGAEAAEDAADDIGTEGRGGEGRQRNQACVFAEE